MINILIILACLAVFVLIVLPLIIFTVEFFKKKMPVARWGLNTTLTCTKCDYSTNSPWKLMIHQKDHD